MSKIDFNYDNLNSYAVPSLEVAKNNIKKAIGKAQALSIPKNFKYYNYLNGIKSVLNNSYSNVSLVKDKILSTNNALDDLLCNFATEISKIEGIAIPIKESKINVII